MREAACRVREESAVVGRDSQRHAALINQTEEISQSRPNLSGIGRKLAIVPRGSSHSPSHPFKRQLTIAFLILWEKIPSLGVEDEEQPIEEDETCPPDS